MKTAKRFLLILLSLSLVLSFFAACDSRKDNQSDPDTGVSTADINFVDAEGEAAYHIVRAAEGSEDLPITDIIKTIKSKYEVAVKNTSDEDAKGDLYEIVVGKTTREASAKAKQILDAESSGRKSDYIICTIDGDIVIYGNSNDAVTAGIKYFVDTYLTGETIVGGIKYIYNDASAYADISIGGTTRLSDYKLVRPIYNVSYITQIQTDKLLEFISEKTGYIVEQINDNIASTTGKIDDGSGTLTPSETNEYEIVVGNAVRDGVKTFTEKEAYEIRIEGKKIYLNGGTPHAIAMAVSEFIKLVENNNAITDEMSVLNGDYNAVIDNYDVATYYRPTWGDDFDGNEINYNIWNVGWDRVSGYSSAANGKDQYRGSSELKNNYVKDGVLYQVAVETDDAYYGGWFDTCNKMNFLYGFAEVSTIHPKGMGFWSSFWTVSESGKYPEYSNTAFYNSETDIDECYGPGTWAYGNTFAWPTSLGVSELELENASKGTVHVNNKVTCKDDRGFYMDFHTFGFEWNGNKNVKFTCDGEVYVDQDLREGAEQLAYELPQVVYLSLACGSGNHGQPTTDPIEWEYYNKYIVDWIRLYQVKGQKLYNWSDSAGRYIVVKE